jgi:hypothetical protein
LATATGLIPANMIHYKTGNQLSMMLTNEEKTPAWQNFAVLIVLQFLALIPAFFKKHIKYE